MPGTEFFDKLEETWQEHFLFKDGDKIIKVAVLDTGINLDHPDFQKARTTGFDEDGTPKLAENEQPQITRISSKGRKNFATGLQGGDDVNDVNGHGTKVAGLILRLAPSAEIYIARIFDGELADKDSKKMEAQTVPLENTVTKVSLPSVVLISPSRLTFEGHRVGY